MAITATYSNAGKEIKNAYIKLTRIWGSKSEGWCAWVAVFADPTDKEYQELFSVSTEYVDGQDVFAELYSKVKTLSFLSDVKDHFLAKEETSEPQAVVPLVEEQPKKSRSKKK